MTREPSIKIHQARFPKLPTIRSNAIVIAVVSALVLILGWVLGIEWMPSLLPGFPTTKPITSVSFIVLALGVIASLQPGRGLTIVAGLIGAAVAIWICLLAFFGIGHIGTGDWALMPSPATQLGLVLCGIALAILSWAPRYRSAALLAALAIATVSIYHNLDMLILRRAPPQVESAFDSMSLITAVLLAWFMIACVVLHPRMKISKIVFKPSLRGRILRRTFMLVLLLPLIASAVTAAMSAAYNWTDDMLFAFTATLPVIIGAVIIWRYSAEIERWQSEAAQRASALTRANQALERYAMSIAHDLKEPSRHVKIYSDMLDEALANGDYDQASKHARKLSESAARLPLTIDSLLQFSQSAFTRIHLGDHYLIELVQGAATTLGDAIAESGMRVTIAENTLVRCDASLIASVFQNLLSNSIKHAQPSTPLVIEITAVPVDRGCQITFQDNGKGFDPEFIPLAFNPLARGAISETAGSGIGLTTCRTIVESHGGEIGIDASYTDGARLRFTLQTSGAVDFPAPAATVDHSIMAGSRTILQPSNAKTD